MVPVRPDDGEAVLHPVGWRKQGSLAGGPIGPLRQGVPLPGGRGGKQPSGLWTGRQATPIPSRVKGSASHLLRPAVGADLVALAVELIPVDRSMSLLIKRVA